MHCLLNPGAKVVCIREVQKTLNQSAKALIELKIQEFGVGSQFRVLYDRIETPGNGLIIFQGMQDMNAESIKSLEGYNIAWVEEAQTLCRRSQERLADRDVKKRDADRSRTPSFALGRITLLDRAAVKAFAHSMRCSSLAMLLAIRPKGATG